MESDDDDLGDIEDSDGEKEDTPQETVTTENSAPPLMQKGPLSTNFNFPGQTEPVVEPAPTPAPPILLPIRSATEDNQDELEKDRHRAIIKAMNPAQKMRYEAYRNSKIPKAFVKSIMSKITSQTIKEEVVMFMCGASKVFVGELVETALAISGDNDDSHPALRPRHLREAFRQLQRVHKVGSSRTSERPLLRR